MTQVFNITKEEAATIFIDDLREHDQDLAAFSIDTNLRAAKKMMAVGEIEEIIQLYVPCAQGWSPIEINMSEHEIVPRNLMIKIKFCIDQLQNSLLQTLGMNMPEVAAMPVREQILTLVLELIRRGVRRDVLRASWLGNTSSPNKALQVTDGFLTVHIPKLIADGVVTDGTLPNIATPGATLTWLNNATESFVDKFIGIDTDQIVFYVSSNVYRAALRDQRAANGSATEMAIKEAREGYGLRDAFFYNGVLVREAKWIKRYTNTQFAFATTQGNMHIGYDRANAFGDLEVFYDRVTKHVHVENQFTLGTSYILPNLITSWGLTNGVTPLELKSGNFANQ